MGQLDQMTAAVREAELTLEAADAAATKMARLLVGRLRRVSSPYILRLLKKELSAYNMKTRNWKGVA